MRISIFILILVLSGCTLKTDKTSLETWKNEIVKTEADFCALAVKSGLEVAFTTYAHETAVLMRNDKLIIGRNAIQQYFSQPSELKDLQLVWKPDFVDVSISGDLGYTYGEFQLTYNNSDGEEVKNEGVFHTVWKKGNDGNWKFVWD